jgi:EAL domain-containing protein (putative c-di-GMP-specific phosphodiesterase class I)
MLQGFHFGRPMPAADFTKMLARSAAAKEPAPEAG